eukprot:gene18882-14218_t
MLSTLNGIAVLLALASPPPGYRLGLDGRALITSAGPLQLHADVPKDGFQLGLSGTVAHTRVTYLSSAATNPPDVLVLYESKSCCAPKIAKEYEIVAGLDILIPKGVSHEVVSSDPRSLRVLARPPHDVVTMQSVGTATTATTTSATSTTSTISSSTSTTTTTTSTTTTTTSTTSTSTFTTTTTTATFTTTTLNANDYDANANETRQEIVSTFKAKNMSATEMLSKGYTPNDLLNGGYTATTILNASCPVDERAESCEAQKSAILASTVPSQVKKRGGTVAGLVLLVLFGLVGGVYYAKREQQRVVQADGPAEVNTLAMAENPMHTLRRERSNRQGAAVGTTGVSFEDGTIADNGAEDDEYFTVVGTVDGYEVPVSAQQQRNSSTAAGVASPLYAIPFERDGTASAPEHTAAVGGSIYAVPFERSSSINFTEGGYVEDNFICERSGSQAGGMPDYAEPTYATPAEDAEDAEVEGGSSAA